MTLPKYREYKESGVDWIGKIPSHWKIEPIKRGFAVVGGSTPRSDEPTFWGGDIVWVSPADLSRLKSMYIDGSARMISLAGLNSCGTTLVPAGSVVLSTRAPIGSLAIANTMLCTNQGCKSLVPSNEASSLYFAYVLLSATKPLNLKGKGTTFLELSGDDLAGFKVPFPPKSEQLAIAAFLDRETNRIDVLIAEQEKLIALLAEKRQATISHAVTRGLNPNAPMKDSGDPWLGEVPMHWMVERVKTVARLESGHTPSKQVAEYWEDCDIPWVSLNDSKYLATHDYISDTSVKINELGLANSSARIVPAGSVVFTRDATIGLAAITTVPSAVSQHLIAWCPSQRITSLFLLRVLNAMKPYLDSYTFGATIKTIGMGDVKKLVTTVPPLEEQLAITMYLDSEMRKLESLRREARRSVVLLKERRNAIIAAAVTGMIDLRGEAGGAAA